jgi:hypothetical protein
MNYRKTKLYKTMNNYIACSIVENFNNEKLTEKEILTAWQWLADTGLCWKLQGWYGRTVHDLIVNGILSKPPKQHRDYYGNAVKF